MSYLLSLLAWVIREKSVNVVQGQGLNMISFHFWLLFPQLYSMKCYFCCKTHCSCSHIISKQLGQAKFWWRFSVWWDVFVPIMLQLCLFWTVFCYFWCFFGGFLNQDTNFFILQSRGNHLLIPKSSETTAWNLLNLHTFFRRLPIV